jgi:putative peptidoglycan lipid II flippase
VPSFAISVLGGTFSSAFVPAYVQMREREGPAAADKLFSHVLAFNFVILIAVAVLLALAAPYVLAVIASGFSPDKLALTHTLFIVLLPCLIVSAVAKMWGAVLNAGERFALASVSAIMVPICAISFLVLGGEKWGIFALAAGTIAGFLGEAALLGWSLRRHGLTIAPRWPSKDVALQKVMRQYLPVIGGAFLMTGAGVVDQAMAAALAPGSVSALAYGSKVVTSIIGIGTAGLSTAVLPHFSRMAALQNWQGIRHTLNTYLRLILLVTIPLTLLLILISEPLAGLIFERGAFTAADTKLVGRVQACYLLQLPFNALGLLGVRLLNALHRNEVLMFISGVNLLVNIVGNYVLMQFMGVAGISLSTSLVYIVSMILIYYFALTRLRDRQ